MQSKFHGPISYSIIYCSMKLTLDLIFYNNLSPALITTHGTLIMTFTIRQGTDQYMQVVLGHNSIFNVFLQTSYQIIIAVIIIPIFFSHFQGASAAVPTLQNWI